MRRIKPNHEPKKESCQNKHGFVKVLWLARFRQLQGTEKEPACWKHVGREGKRKDGWDEIFRAKGASSGSGGG